MIKNQKGIVVPDDYSKYEQMKSTRELKKRIQSLEAQVSNLTSLVQSLKDGNQ